MRSDGCIRKGPRVIPLGPLQVRTQIFAAHDFREALTFCRTLPSILTTGGHHDNMIYEINALAGTAGKSGV